MSNSVGRKATYADLEALPENRVGQILDGELISLPRPALEQAIACTAIAGQLGGPFQVALGGPGGWWIVFEPEVHLGEDVLVPDVAGWRNARLARPSGPFVEVSPDWACEVLSPSTVRIDRDRKMRIYAREGVEHLWLVDPLGHTLEVHRLDGARWSLLGVWSGEERVRAAPFEAVELDLAPLWPAAR